MFSDVDRHMPISVLRKLIDIGAEIIDQSPVTVRPLDGHQAHLSSRVWLHNERWFTVPALVRAPDVGVSVWMLKRPCPAFPLRNCLVQWPGDEYFKGNHSKDFACTAKLLHLDPSKDREPFLSFAWPQSSIHINTDPRPFVVISVPKIIRKA